MAAISPPPSWITLYLSPKNLCLHYLRLQDKNMTVSYFIITDATTSEFQFHFSGFPVAFHYKRIDESTIISTFNWILYSVLLDGRAVYLLNFTGDLQKTFNSPDTPIGHKLIKKETN